jgi:hypothetical protein
MSPHFDKAACAADELPVGGLNMKSRQQDIARQGKRILWLFGRHITPGNVSRCIRIFVNANFFAAHWAAAIKKDAKFGGHGAISMNSCNQFIANFSDEFFAVTLL